MPAKIAADPVIRWLLQGDPAIRWQVLRDLLDQPRPRWQTEQARVAREGWGARLLSRQDEAGRWTPRLYGKKWISTTYSMMLLRHFGLLRGNPRVARACRLFLHEALRQDGGINAAVSLERSETCLTGMVLGLPCWFCYEDPRREVVEPAFTRFSFPPRWRHDVLRTLDHFRAAAAPYDERIEDPLHW